MIIGVSELWTAAGVLLGFQVTSFLWRITQEAEVSDRGDICWLPAADLVNLAGMLVVVAGVFLAPILGIGAERVPSQAFGLAVLLFVGHCFALAGHYELFNNRSNRSFTYFPFQERVVLGVLGMVVVLYLAALAIYSVPQRRASMTDGASMAAVASTEGEERYTWAFAQNIDDSTNSNESCRQSLAEALYFPANEVRITRKDASNVFLFSGTVETYWIHAFRSQMDCEAALTDLRARRQSSSS